MNIEHPQPAEQAASSGEAQREDETTFYLGLLWRHAAASFRNDDAEADKWAELGDAYHRKVGEPADYKDGARWLAQCVAEWPTTPPPAGPVASLAGDAKPASPDGWDGSPRPLTDEEREWLRGELAAGRVSVT